VTLVEKTRVGHEWRVVAPWWHWPEKASMPSAAAASVAAGVRQSRPVIQKYDTPDFVNTFLADPQLRLAFNADTDETATVTSASLGSFPTRTPTGMRKVYLPTHHRNYLVACSLHCDAAGFPSVDRTAVCQAGFVVRRRAVVVPPAEQLKGTKLMQALTKAMRKREGTQQQLTTALGVSTTGAVRLTSLRGRFEAAVDVENAARKALAEWANRLGVERQLNGWVPHGVDAKGQLVPVDACAKEGGAAPLAGTGAWLPVDEMADTVDEAWFPLYPLVADPTKPDHDATGETVWFGTLPAGGSDLDLQGKPRFDDRSTYEIRCFVRRHRAECPRDSSHCACPVTWSEPTEPYQLASQFDLEGTSNRPFTVQLPDLKQLQADALRVSPAAGVRFVTPPDSALNFTATGLDASKLSGAFPQICSFSIPLITIIAMFVLQIFLPIVVFVFQLWWMLLLKFCIPPQLTVAGGFNLDAALTELQAPDVDIAAFASVDTSELAKLLNALFGGLKNKNNVSLAKSFRNAVGSTVDVKSFAAVARGVAINNKQDANAPLPPPPARAFAPRVRREDVVSP